METDGYNDGNRAFLQAFMAHSFMTFEEIQPVLAAIISAQGTSTSNYQLAILLIVSIDRESKR